MNVVTSAIITIMVNSGGDRMPRSIPAFRITSSTSPRVFIRTPRPSESSQFIPVALAVMARIEHRTLADYGLPRTGVSGRRLVEGVVWGIAMVTGMVLLQRAEGVFHFGTLALSGGEALKMGSLWAAGNLCVGFFEEITYRGYFQSTLTSGMGFWRAAVLTSLLFGMTHIATDSFYSWTGVVSATLFGFAYCLILWRTGSLWMAIGFHAATDFAETFLFAPPEPKFQTVGHLLNCTLSGPAWLTGGSVGPEASLNGLILFVVVFVLLWRVRFGRARALDTAQR